MPVVDHVQVTVKDMAAALPFYDRLLAILGFDVTKRTEAVLEEHDMHVAEYHHERLIFAVLTDEDVGDVLELPERISSLILDGLRPDRK